MDHEEGLCVGCGEVTTDTIECNCTQAIFACAACCDSEASLRCGVPRAGAPGRVRLPGLRGRPGTRQGHGRLSARGGAGWRVGDLHAVPSDGAANGRRATAGLHVGIQPTWVPCRVQRHGPFSGAPSASVAAFSRTRFAGAAERPCRRAAGNGLARPSNAGKAAVSSRHALPPTARQRRQYKRSGY